MDNPSIWAQWGLPGIIIGVLFVQNFFLVRQLIDVIKTNTAALQWCKARNERGTHESSV